ncbi:uncharacterized protein [Apostichopus japonicus]|uniref:uncharacterized protein isoform X3 n=1 Tax=Stichopus japonicus TaxID=307972 RepID=UPI003AB8D891
MLPWEIYCSNYSIGTSAHHQWRMRATAKGACLLDAGSDKIFRGKKANQVSTRGGPEFTRYRELSHFQREEGQLASSFHQRGVWIHGLFELTSNPAASIFLAMDSSGPLFVMFVALWSLY